MKQILFLCTGKAVHIQRAEALIRHYYGDEFDVFSTGTDPEGVHLQTIPLLK